MVERLDVAFQMVVGRTTKRSSLYWVFKRFSNDFFVHAAAVVCVHRASRFTPNTFFLAASLTSSTNNHVQPHGTRARTA